MSITTYEVKSNLALVYKKASLFSGIIGILSKGAQIEVLEITNRWICFIFNGTEAYVRKSLIKISITTIGSVTVKYLNADTKEPIIDDEVYNNLELGDYTYTAKDITNYTLSSSQSVTVTLTENNTTYTVIFEYK